MAQNTPWRLKNSNIFWGGPPDPPGGGAPPSHLALHEKMAAVPPSLVPAINTFVPGTSNLNKNPALNSLFQCPFLLFVTFDMLGRHICLK